MKILNDLVIAGDISAKNLSGTNTGDQDLSNLVPRTTSTDESVVRFDGITGDLQNSKLSIDDNGKTVLVVDSYTAPLGVNSTLSVTSNLTNGGGLATDIKSIRGETSYYGTDHIYAMYGSRYYAYNKGAGAVDWLYGNTSLAANDGNGAATNIAGIYSQVRNAGTGLVNKMMGVYSTVTNSSTNASNNDVYGSANILTNSGVLDQGYAVQNNLYNTGTINQFNGLQLNLIQQTGHINQVIGVEIGKEHNWDHTGTVDDSYAVFIDASTNIGTVNSYAIKSESTAPSELSGTITASNLSGTNTGDQDLSNLVPYTGATQDISVNDKRIVDVKEVQYSNDITFTDEQKALMPIGSKFWDNTNRCLTTKVSADVYVQDNQEQNLLLKANSTALSNGRYVRIVGYDLVSNLFLVEYSDCSTLESSYVDYMLTEDIAIGGTGIGIKNGVVHDLNTSTGTSNAPVYLGTQGQPSPTAPLYPNYIVVTGTYGYIDATNGNILVDINKPAQYAINNLQNQVDLKGMTNPGVCQKLPILPIDIVIDSVAKTFTIATVNNGTAITPANPIRVFTDGSGIISRWEKTTPQTVSFTKTNGVWYVHFDSTGTLIATQTPWTEFNTIATIYRFYINDQLSDADMIVVRAWEAHLNDISASDHAWKHTQGTIYESGFDIICNKLASGSPAASGLNTCLSLTTGKNSDDGLEYTVTNTQTPSLNFQQDLGILIAGNLTISNGALFKVRTNDSAGRLNFLPATRFPFAWNSVSNRPEFVTNMGVRSLVSSGNFFVYYIYALQDNKVNEAIKIVSAEIDFATIILANAHSWETIQSLYATMNDKEIRPLYKLIFEYRSNYDVAVKYSVLREYNDIRKYKTTTTSVTSGSILASNVITVPKTIQTATNLDSNMQIIDNLLVGGTTSQVLTSGVGSIPTWTTQSASNVSAAAKTKITGTTVESQLQSVNDSFIKGITSSVDNELVRFDSTTGKVIQGGSGVTVSDTGDVIIPGNVTINGTLTNINTDTLQVKDKNIELGYLTSGTPTDVTANGGGITLKGTTDKNITWLSSNDSWNFDKPIVTTGNATANALISTAATGTSPLTVTSTTIVPNLNADMVDGVQANDITRLVAFTPSPDLNINKWTKIASLQAPGDYSPFSLTLSIDVVGQSYGSCIVNFTVRQETSGGAIIVKNVKILSAVGESTFIDGSIKMVNNGYAQPFEIWLKSTANYNTYNVRELNKNLSSYSLTYYSNYAWTATEPTGTYTATNTGLAYLNSRVLHTGMLDYVKLNSDGSSVNISGQNLNNIRIGGFYRGNNLVGAPLGASSWFYITIISYEGLSWTFQEAVSYGIGVGGTGNIPDGVKYRRSFINGIDWQPWQVVYDATNANNATTKWTAGLLSVYPVNGGDYNEGIRIHPKDGYSILALGAVDGDTGRGEGQWTFIKHPVASNHMLTIRHYTTDIVTIQKEGQLLVGGKTGTPTASPISLSLGGTYSNAAGSNLKLKLYEDNAGNPPAGFGVSAGRLEYVVGNAVEDHVFYAVTTELFKLKGNGNIELMVANATVDGRDISVDGSKLDTLKKDTYINIIDGVAAGSQTIIPQGTGYRGISDIIIKCTSSVNVTYPSSIDVKYYDYTNTLRTIICPTTAIPGIIQRVTSIFGTSPLPQADLSYGPITVEWAKSGGTPTEHKYEIICKID